MNKGFFFSSCQPDDSLEKRSLRVEIDRIRRIMESAENHFEQEVDPTLIDCSIYEWNAAQLRYQFLLQQYKHLEERTKAAAHDVDRRKARWRPGFASPVSLSVKSTTQIVTRNGY